MTRTTSFFRLSNRSAYRPGWPGDRSHLFGVDGLDLGRDQFACDCFGGRYLSPLLGARPGRWALSVCVTLLHRLLGSVCGRFRDGRRARFRRTHRASEYCRIPVLWRAAGCVCPGVLLPASRRNGRFLWRHRGRAAIFWAAAFTSLSFLWYNVVGCLAVVGGWDSLSPGFRIRSRTSRRS